MHYLEQEERKRNRRGGKDVKLLVHCMAGVSRSASIVIGWLVWSRKLNLMEAYDHVKERRPRIKPRILPIIAIVEKERWEREEIRTENELKSILDPKRKRK